MSERHPVTVVCVIPAFQAAATLGAVAAELRRALPSALLVAVDDGSRDRTADEAARCCDVVVLGGRNRGKGAALRLGIARALDMGADVVVTIDADGQHDPAAASALTAALHSADVAIGVRTRGGSSMPLPRRLTNGASALAMSLCAGTSLKDPQSGYRAFRRAVLERVSGEGDGYEYETYLLLKCCRAGFRVAEVPVATLYGPASHFRPVRDTSRVVRAIWRHRGGAFRSRRELAGDAAR
jgi:glycosyltransferase involved in cell wall biosynthesis